MQNITISGFLAKDAEQREVRDGSVTALTIPVKQGWGDKETTNWFRANVWGKRADFAGKLTKGTFIVVTGELSIGEYNGKVQYEIRVNDFHTAPTGERQGQSREQRKPDGSRGAPADNSGWGDDDDSDIPFITDRSIY